MQTPIEKFRALYGSRRRHYRVEELDLDLYFSPLTTADIIAVDGQEFGGGDHERNVALLIQKAELEDGTPAFQPEDRQDLIEKADYVVVQKILNELFRASVSAKELRGKSGPTDGSSSDAP